jgi:E3 ubiquitin-protein ligase ZNF598
MTDSVPDPPTPQRSRQNPRGPRRQGGIGSHNPYHPDESQRGHGFRGGRGERGGKGRGRGDSSRSSFMPDAQLIINNARASDTNREGDALHPLLNGDRGNQGEVVHEPVDGQEKPAEEGEVCFICASSIEHLSIAPCNHQTCHICALRLRALYKKRDCAYCKVSISSLL